MQVPIFAVLVFCGLIYQDCFLQKMSSGNADGNDADDDDDDDDGVTNEHTELIPSSSDNGNNRRNIRRVRRASQVRVSQSCSVDSEKYRRMSLEVDGIVIPNETKTEKLLMDKLYADKQEWDEIQEASSEYISEEFSMSWKNYTHWRRRKKKTSTSQAKCKRSFPITFHLLNTSYNLNQSSVVIFFSIIVAYL